jgi:ketosteroid isomerase-like protein
MMTKRRAFLLSFVAVVSACASAPTRSAAAPSDLAAAEQAIRPILLEMLAAANAHDTDRHLAFYTPSPDLVFVINDEAIHGLDALRERQRQWWQDGKSNAVYELLGSPEYRMPAPGVVIQTYFLKSTRSVAGGPPRSSSFGISAVWRQQAEGWRIVYAHEATVTR